MTTKEIIESKYLPWLRAIGITAIPEIKLADWDPVPGFEPPLEVKWRGTSGSKLDQPADLIAADIVAMDAGINGKMNLWQYEVRACVGGEPVSMIPFTQFINPPKPPTLAPGSSPIGSKLEKEYVSQFNVSQSREYFAVVGAVREGAIYTQDGRRYQCFRPTPFALWWVGL